MSVRRETQREKFIVAVRPLRSDCNAFINRFGACVADSRFTAVPFSWKRLMQYDAVIFHWPNEFFARRPMQVRWQAALKLFLTRVARRVCGVRVIWIAHNAQPHDLESSARSARGFLRALDGIVHLSQHSYALLGAQYELSSRTRQIVTVHGHYRDDAVMRPQPFVAPEREVRLLYFGQVRPYKGVEELVACVARMKDRGVRLKVVGVVEDEPTAARVKELARLSPQIELDLRPEPLSDAELEAAVDDAHAVVLPYRRILNSGAAMYTMSRNRLLLAPRQGSLPELQGAVGREWVHLYEGDLTVLALQAFVEAVRRGPGGATADLSVFEWDGIAEKIHGLLSELMAPRRPRRMHSAVFGSTRSSD